MNTSTPSPSSQPIAPGGVAPGGVAHGGAGVGASQHTVPAFNAGGVPTGGAVGLNPVALPPTAPRPPLVFPYDPNTLGERYCCNVVDTEIILARMSRDHSVLMDAILDGFYARFVQEFGFSLTDPRVRAVALDSFKYGLVQLNERIRQGGVATGRSGKDDGHWAYSK